MVDRTYRCPVCGYPYLSEQPRSRNNVPSFEICVSCGFQFGVTDDDDEQTYESWRDQWIRHGMPWSSKRSDSRPDGWDPERQLYDLLNSGRPE